MVLKNLTVVFKGGGGGIGPMNLEFLTGFNTVYQFQLYNFNAVFVVY